MAYAHIARFCDTETTYNYFPHVKNLKNLKINCRCLRLNGTKIFDVKLSANGVSIVSETNRWFTAVSSK